MKKLRLLCLICVTLITVYSCCTPVTIEPEPPIFPPKPSRVVLVADGNVNEYRLIVQDIRWMLWASFVEWKSGIITDDEYSADKDRLEGLIREYDKIFQTYLDQLPDR